MGRGEYKTIDEYICIYPEEMQKLLEQIREIIKKAAPDATEKISWDMPTFYLYGNLVHFAIHKNHIGFYPGESGVANFEDKLKDYHTSKGAIQFPIDKPLPTQLITEIVKFRVKENTNWNEEKEAKKAKKK